MAQITYTDKVAINTNSGVADINKVKAEDMNEIKSVVNGNYNEVGTLTNLNTTDKTSIVNAINEVNNDSGWIDLTITNTFKNYNNDNNNRPRVRKIGKLVEVRGIITPVNEIPANQDTTIGTLPSGYRPSTCQVVQIYQGSGQNRWALVVNTSGVLVFQRYGTTSNIAIPSGAWLPFQTMFFVD